MVFQHFSLFEALSVAENIALGMNKGVADADLDHRITEVSNTYGLSLDPKRYVGSLSVGERQRVEIIRCLLQNPRLLIMDEPTSVLTPQEVRSLFKTLRQLSAEGCSILYISHKLELIIYSKEKSVWRYLSPIFCNLFSRRFKSKKNSTILKLKKNSKINS